MQPRVWGEISRSSESLESPNRVGVDDLVDANGIWVAKIENAKEVRFPRSEVVGRVEVDGGRDGGHR